MRLSRSSLAAAALLALTGAFAPSADAQRAPYGSSRYDDRYDQRQGQGHGQARDRNVAGQFDYYALVLSWSPTHCAANGDRDGDETQCARRDGRRYNFVLHGLWPQYERGYPESCPTRDRPFVPDRVIDGIMDIMPSKRLAIHEYKKHGTCSGLDPAGYYDLARQMFNRIRIPERYVNPFDVQFVAPEEFMREMIAANPELKPDMLAISCGGPGNRLREIRICHTKSGQLRPCGHNENQRKLCSARQMYVPPVRSTSKDPAAAGKGAASPPRRDEPANRNDNRGGQGQPRSKDYLPGPRGI